MLLSRHYSVRTNMYLCLGIRVHAAVHAVFKCCDIYVSTLFLGKQLIDISKSVVSVFREYC